MGTWIAGILIASYVLWVIVRKIKRIKEGKYCDCGCDSCSKKNCSSKEK